MEQWSASIPSIAPTAIQDLPAVVIYRIVGHSPNITGSSEGTHHPPATCVLSHWVHHTESAYLPRVKKNTAFCLLFQCVWTRTFVKGVYLLWYKLWYDGSKSKTSGKKFCCHDSVMSLLLLPFVICCLYKALDWVRTHINESGSKCKSRTPGKFKK